MRISFTPGQIAMLIQRAERQLEQIVADSVREAGDGRNNGYNITRGAQHMLHETVVTLIRLYREQVPEGAPVATRIARAYAKGADARTGLPTLACVRSILSIVHEAGGSAAPAPPQPQPERAQHRPAALRTGPA